ncbi:monooxygenase flavin-binding family protein [Alcanivorax sp. S71-1-4]|uniref:flavin-containing monooxygenase n=1 Tax=Alcanivorax sp. S71-1-4 TaxID=1177159 RepID=UPI0013569A4A|nr:NAD(P)/FAD-dependent oxidoreductase [Alcanivorax sp. S71-1-4]KAF0810626.1 monooxygenase flavin-binding family protein [Alcanivorax sp. S71-1-4]
MSKKVSTKNPVAHVDVVIVGAGFGGLCMAIRLREQGHDDFVVLEKAGEVGGAWHFNGYPGAGCDVQSHLYSYSFAGKPDWSKRYAPQGEIEQYILDVTEQYGLRPFIRFHQEVNAAHFDAATARWTVRTARGDTFVCRHFVLASGPLHVPNIPAIPGLSDFKGKVMHSAEWDHDYDLAGKRVISIGTGGSAIQYCPEIAPVVKSLSVFQRTAAWVVPRDERGYPGISKALFRRFPSLRRLHRARLYWSNESRVLPASSPRAARVLEALCRAFIRFQVRDRKLARALTPDYAFGCKRVLISNKWYPMFNRDNVSLVTAGIREVRAHSVVTEDGVEHPADCLILGTGFVVDPRIYMRDFPLTGLPGHALAQDWAEAAEAYYGVTVSGYPNLYMLVGPNTGLGHNSILFMIECQVNYILQCMRLLNAEEADYLDVKPAAQRAFNEAVQRRLQGTTWTSGCTSWYQQADGRNFALWPGATWRYWLETRRVCSTDYEFVSLEEVRQKGAA